jgi:hypothetical protein
MNCPFLQAGDSHDVGERGLGMVRQRRVQRSVGFGQLVHLGAIRAAVAMPSSVSGHRAAFGRIGFASGCFRLLGMGGGLAT